jgi:hypothetical protein
MHAIDIQPASKTEPNIEFLQARFANADEIFFEQLDFNSPLESFILCKYNYRIGQIIFKKKFDKALYGFYFINDFFYFTTVWRKKFFEGRYVAELCIMNTADFELVRGMSVRRSLLAFFPASSNFMASVSVRNENDEEYVEYLVPCGKKMDTVKIILNGLPDSRTILNGCVIDERKYILYGSTREALWILTCQNNYYEIGKYDTASGIYTKQFELPEKGIWNNLMDLYVDFTPFGRHH